MNDDVFDWNRMYKMIVDMKQEIIDLREENSKLRNYREKLIDVCNRYNIDLNMYIEEEDIYNG